MRLTSTVALVQTILEYLHLVVYHAHTYTYTIHVHVPGLQQLESVGAFLVAIFVFLCLAVHSGEENSVLGSGRMNNLLINGSRSIHARN